MTYPSPVLPRAASVTTVTTGGTAVNAFSEPVNGFLLQNPIGATETLYFNMVGTAATTASGSTFGLAAGGQFLFEGPTQTITLSVNAATSAHVFSCIVW